MYAVVMFLKTVWGSHGVFYFRSRVLCFKQPIKKIRINSKILCPLSPSFLVPRPQPAKRSEKGYGDENGCDNKGPTLAVVRGCYSKGTNGYDCTIFGGYNEKHWEGGKFY